MVNQKLSPAMERTLQMLQEDVLDVYPTLGESNDLVKLSRQATKNKEMIAVIPFLKITPMFELFINEKFYGTYVYLNKKWSERKD